MFSRLNFLLFFTCLIVVAIVTAQKATASQNWSPYVSETQLFSVLMPGKPDETIGSFRVGDGLMVNNSEVLSFIDQRPYKNTVKNYVVKLDQSLGSFIGTDYQVRIIERELDLYVQIYEEKNAVIVDKTVEVGNVKTQGNMILTYEDEDEGLQAVRIRIIINSNSLFHQIFSGPEKDLNTTITEQYFKSLNIQSGVIAIPGSMNEDWRRIESPMSLFAIKVPPITPPYFSSEPNVSKEKKKERIGMVFTDPIWAQNVFYSVTGYQLESEMSFELAKKALLEKHMKRHGRNEVGVTFNKDFIGETPYIEAKYAINSPKGYPYIDKVRIRSMFLGNYMIVQEVIGAEHLVESSFVQSFFNLIEFTPKKAFQKELQRHLNSANGAPEAH